MFSNRLVSVLVLAGIIFGLGGCASQIEKQARRDNAFDLSGQYKVTKNAKSEVEMNYEIVNEGGRYDIYAKLTRLSSFTQKEMDLIKKVGVDPGQIQHHFFAGTSPLILGKGYNNNGKGHPLEGGENISDDFGETSRFSICSQSLVVTSQPKLEASYCLTGLVEKKNKMLSGKLVLVFLKTEQKKDKEGKDVTEYTYQSADVVYQSSLDLVFYRQYLGQWTGTVYPTSEIIDPKKMPASLSIDAINEGTFAVSPGARNPTLQIAGETYTYNSSMSQRALIEIQKPDYPAVLMVYTSPSGRRMLWTGQLWSLGHFSGSIIIENPDGSQVILGSFRYKKI